MRLLAFSDWRVQSIEMINEAIEEEKPDIIVYAGDDLDRVIPFDTELFLKTKSHFVPFNEETIINKQNFVVNSKNKDAFTEKIRESKTLKKVIKTNNIPFYYVNGNDDVLIKNGDYYYIRVSTNLTIRTDHDYYNISETPKGRITIKKSVSFNVDVDNKEGFYRRSKYSPIFGAHMVRSLSLYGSECGFGLTTKIHNLPDQFVDVLLVHIPPLGCLDLSTRFGCQHIGSNELLTYINKYQPKFVICGHSHFWGGKARKINNTTVINISSHDIISSPGNYTVINLETGEFEIKSKNFKSIRQMRGAYFGIIENMDIYGTLFNSLSKHNLLSNNNDKITKCLEENGKENISNRIHSLTWDKPKIIKKLSFEPKNYAFVDIETGLPQRINPKLSKRKLWLIGLLYRGEVYQFEYPAQKNLFIKFLTDRHINELVSWTSFDSKNLKIIKKLGHIKWIDACQRVSNCIIWHSYKLHELYDVIFDNIDNEIIDGAVAGIYADHIIYSKKVCKYCPSEDVVKDEIRARNKKDLTQMYEICELLWNWNE